MKSRTYLLYTVIGSLLVFAGFWAYYEVEGNFRTSELFEFGIIILLVAFALFIAIRRFSSERRGQAAEDELSRKVTQKAASSSFYISLYMWLLVSLLSREVNISTETLIGYGIVGMALLFAGNWLFYKVRGVKDV
jgi:peptidoglycan/LPS O-acetylase OafA/YrhL